MSDQEAVPHAQMPRFLYATRRPKKCEWSPVSGRNSPDQLRFVDLFAGLGGFHVALSSLGHRCVLASEIDPELSDLYAKNFGIRPHGDIRTVRARDIPDHDLLCAGFPCQNYSKAGAQLGLDCPKLGDLVEYILAILTAKRPRMLIMENVPNLMRHENGKTWASIRLRLIKLGYSVAAIDLGTMRKLLLRETFLGA